MAIEDDDDIGLFATGFVVGCIIPTRRRPTFCIPVIAPLEIAPKSANITYIQRVGADGQVRSFDIFDIDAQHFIPLKQPFSRISIGDPCIFVISIEEDRYIVGEKTTLAPIVRSLLSRLHDQHLTRLAFADFCGLRDAVISAAKASFLAKSNERGLAAAKRWFTTVILYNRVQRGLLRRAADLGRATQVEREMDAVELGTRGSSLIVRIPQALRWLADPVLDKALRAECRVSGAIGIRSIKVVVASGRAKSSGSRQAERRKISPDAAASTEAKLIPDQLSDLLSPDALETPFDISADDLARFLREYELGELLSYKMIASRFASNILLHCRLRSFVVTLFKKRTPIARLRFSIQFMTRLTSQGVPCADSYRRPFGAQDKEAGWSSGGAESIFGGHSSETAAGERLWRVG